MWQDNVWDVGESCTQDLLPLCELDGDRPLSMPYTPINLLIKPVELISLPASYAEQITMNLSFVLFSGPKAGPESSFANPLCHIQHSTFVFDRR